MALRRRWVGVDAFRGFAIAAMILVNNPGSWADIYGPLRHADWHGCTVADLVFPSFLFIVGVAIALALSRRTSSGKVLRRSAVLFALGLMLSAVPELDLATLRVSGVLQRIAICYGAAALLFLHARPRAELWVAGAILLAYWPLLTLVGAPDLSQPGPNLASTVDAHVLGVHQWRAGAAGFDPEGLLSTLPALATTLIGVAVGRTMLGAPATREGCARLLATGIALAVVGYGWGELFPINKALWTSSYAVFTAGLATVALACCTWAFDVRDLRTWARPLVIFGVNALAVFVGSGLLARLAGESIRARIYADLLAPALPAKLASLSYAVVWLAGWFAVLAWMHRRNIIIKV